MPKDAQTLFDNLDRTHPDYDSWSPEWERYRDVMGDDLENKEAYLHKGRIELQKDYELRLKLSEFMPESRLAIDRFIGALYDEKPKRDLGDQESDLKQFMDRSTRNGKSWNKTMEKVAKRAIAYGTTRILINVPTVRVKGQLTRADEQELNVRPFLIDYSPLAVRDWEHDEDGILTFCRIKETRTAKPDGNTLGRPEKVTKFIEYDRESVRWWEFREGKEGDSKLELVDQGENNHGLGVVPMISVELDELIPFIGNSFIRYASKADISKFRNESDLDFDSYTHAHPLLKIWTTEKLAEVGIGASTLLKLDPGSAGNEREDAEYVAQPISAFDALQKIIDSKRQQIFRQAQVDPTGVISGQGSSPFQTSGVARAWSFGTSEARVLSKIADTLEDLETQILDLVLRWQSPQAMPINEPIFKGDIQYPEEFDLASTSQLLTERDQIGQMVNSPTLLRTIDKRIAASKVGDTTAEVLKEIHDEIESNDLLGTMAGQPVPDLFTMPNLEDSEPASEPTPTPKTA